MMMARTMLALLIAATPIVAGAQARTRDLKVPASAAWGHAGSGLVLPPRIAGLARTSVADAGDQELDVVAQYAGPEGAVATVYVYRSQLPSASLWFDRARTVLEQLRLRGDASSAPNAGVSFGLPGQAGSAGLRATYPFEAEAFRSTGVAVAQINGWLVKVRMSGKADPQRLDADLARFVEGINWPQAGAAAAPAEPIAACADKLKFRRRAKAIKPDISQALVGSILAGATLVGTPDPSRRYCRESSEGVAYGTYRLIGTQDSYLLALADSGRAISVRPVPSVRNGDFGKSEDYGVTLLDLAESATYASFNRMPEPKQVYRTVTGTSPISSAAVGGRSMQINIKNNSNR